MGRQRTAVAVQSRAYWPTWSTDLDAFMRQCEPCARYHRGVVPRQAEMQVSLVGEPWERISIDITGPHPKSSRGNVFILTLVDHFSKWAEAMPLSSHTAPVVARALMTHVFSRYGTPLQLLSDRGPEFESELFGQLMKWLEIDKLRTTPYKPSTNGVVERFHRTLNTMLGKVVGESQRDWDERLPLVMAAYRASVHSSTGYSPNRLFLGRENRMPLDLIMGLPSDEAEVARSSNQFVSEMQERAEDAYEHAREQLRVAAERRKVTYDVRVKKSVYAVGDWVWYHYPRRYQQKSMKWQKSFTGPFLIVRIIEPVNYVLQKSPRARSFVVHADKLKKCYGTTPESWLVGDGQVHSHSEDVIEVIPDCATGEVSHEHDSGLQRAPAKRSIGQAPDAVVDIEEIDLSPEVRRGSSRERRPPRHLRDFEC
jgi:transposase InsO family protein